MNPSPAASALLASLSLPAGAATVWPTTRDGQTKLVVKLDRRFWERSNSIPGEFEGFVVVIEANAPVTAQLQAPVEWQTRPKSFGH